VRLMTHRPRLNPLHCGAVVASRVGSAFRSALTSLNPLHCGAVVASGMRLDPVPRGARVSIPFIAGQWSLLPALPPERARRIEVSIPFIAGQWSLLPPYGDGGERDGGSQSPSLRGSGRFAEAEARARREAERLNPLHCGAVVASRRCGSGGTFRRRVSIPFIAGQWSLRTSPDPDGSGGVDVSIPFIAGQWSLQALVQRLRHVLANVSIPFIAGQWSLPSMRRSRGGAAPSLNPLHCGAVVASRLAPRRKSAHDRSQSPSLRGSGRFAPLPRHEPQPASGLNPLHCGAVVASGRPRTRASARCESQSPSLRGSGRFAAAAAAAPETAALSQSPSLRGSGRFWEPDELHALVRFVSIPFIAGQWSLHKRSPRRTAGEFRLNPLHCGAVVASKGTRPSAASSWRVSIPFIAGQWSLRCTLGREPVLDHIRGQPSLRGSGRFSPSRDVGHSSF